MAEKRKVAKQQESPIPLGSTIAQERASYRRRRDLTSVTVPKFLSPAQGFVDFIREQGVIGLAVGLVIGTQVKVLVDQLIASFISPMIGLILPGSGDLVQRSFKLSLGDKTQLFGWGAFASQFISFMAVLVVLYAIVKVLKLDKLDKKDKTSKDHDDKLAAVKRLTASPRK